MEDHESQVTHTFLVYTEGQTENRKGEWAPWINIITIIL